ncbi:MAG TPA: hypothetical protein VGQ94_01200 [Terriglobales bacterium]|nr:hypothetical protein [Terriglobales bacterium]
MGWLGRTIRGYILWTYARGSLHYDIMVTLILLFIFLAPLRINFNDKPRERATHQTGVLVTQDGPYIIYQVDATASDERGQPIVGDANPEAGLHRVIEEIAGEVEIAHYERVTDRSGKVVAYKAWVKRR